MSRPRQTRKRDLVLVAWNANGLAARHSQLLLFVVRHKPDVGLLLIGDTHLTTDRRFRLPNYVCYRDDRMGQPRESTAIAVKSSIRHHCVCLTSLHLRQSCKGCSAVSSSCRRTSCPKKCSWCRTWMSCSVQ